MIITRIVGRTINNKKVVSIELTRHSWINRFDNNQLVVEFVLFIKTECGEIYGGSFPTFLEMMQEYQTIFDVQYENIVTMTAPAQTHKWLAFVKRRENSGIIFVAEHASKLKCLAIVTDYVFERQNEGFNYRKEVRGLFDKTNPHLAGYAA